MRLSRRAVMLAGAALGGGLLVGVAGPAAWLALHDKEGAQRRAVQGGAALVGLWLTIGTDGAVTLLTPHAEMGQGANTGLLQIVADELDVEWDQLRLLPAPAVAGFANGAMLQGFIAGGGRLQGPFRRHLVESLFDEMAEAIGMQVTGGSTSIRFTGWTQLRYAAAAARARLVAAAAARLGVAAEELTTRAGVVTHAASGRTVSYGELAQDAAEIELSDEPVLKERSEWRFVGQPVPRVDLPDKVFGRTVYGIDAAAPGLLYAATRHTAVIGADVTAIDNEAEVLARRGVRSIHRVPEGAVVVADHPWRAEQAARALRLQHAASPHASASSASLEQEQWDGIASDDGLDVVSSEGDAAGNLGPDALQAEYFAPYLAHATMEPLAATLWREGEVVHVALGTQDPLGAQVHVAKLLDVDRDRVVVHPHPMGGGFGRRAGVGDDGYNWLTEAVLVHRESGAPIKLTWSREADLRAGRFRPMTVARIRGRLGDDGLPIAWQGRFYGGAEDVEAVGPSLYPVAHVDIRRRDGDAFVPTTYWRSVDSSTHGFFVESFVDELAAAAAADPLEFRRRWVGAAPSPSPTRARVLALLDAVGAMSSWRRGPDSEGRTLGIAVLPAFGSLAATVAEVSRDPVRVHRVWCAIDCGIAVNPDAVEAQMQGGVQFGLSAALYGRIDIVDGGVRQSNFHDYPLVRAADAARVEVRILPSDGPVGGVGEVGVPGVAPAVANALAVGGPRARRLPLG